MIPRRQECTTTTRVLSIQPPSQCLTRETHGGALHCGSWSFHSPVVYFRAGGGGTEISEIILKAVRSGEEFF